MSETCKTKEKHSLGERLHNGGFSSNLLHISPNAYTLKMQITQDLNCSVQKRTPSISLKHNPWSGRKMFEGQIIDTEEISRTYKGLMKFSDNKGNNK